MFVIFYSVLLIGVTMGGTNVRPWDFFSESFFSRHCYYTYVPAMQEPCQFRVWKFPECSPWNQQHCQFYEANTRTCKTFDCSVIEILLQEIIVLD